MLFEIMGTRDLWENGISLVMSKLFTVKSIEDKLKVIALFSVCKLIYLKKTGIGFACEIGYQKN